MIHVRHAAAAVESGLCETVLITHGESGHSGVGRTPQYGGADQPHWPVRAALWANRAADGTHGHFAERVLQVMPTMAADAELLFSKSTH